MTNNITKITTVMTSMSNQLCKVLSMTVDIHYEMLEVSHVVLYIVWTNIPASTTFI